nr:uncharacterized protein LOC109191080 [Ipomoea batatas]
MADNLRMKRVHCLVECQMCLVKDESAMHLFTECNFSNAVWSMSGLPLITSGFNSFAQWVDLHILKLDVDKCGLLLMLCWKIWTARNDKIWNGKMASPSSLVEGTKCYLADWINIVNMGERNNVAASTKPEQKWERPGQGYLKLNIDAAVRPNNGRMGFSWVLRDEYGLFVAAGSIPGNGVFTPREAEAMAVREALSWIKDHGYSQVEVETDALQIIQSLKQSVDDSSFDLILLDVKDLLLSFTDVAISHVSRTANRVAHSLAREACSMSVRQEWTSVPPSFIVDDLYFDLN